MINIFIVVQLFILLGFYIYFKKFVIVLFQFIEYLGFVLFFVIMIVKLMDVKIFKYVKLCKGFLIVNRKYKICDVVFLIGKLMFIFLGV